MRRTAAPALALNRRRLLQVLPMALGLAGLGGPWAQARAQADAAGQPFSFETLTEEMRALAAGNFVPAEPVTGFLERLDYDDYRLIAFNPDRARLAAPESFFKLHAFSMGWLFREPVLLFQVTDGVARPLTVTTDDFMYLNDLAGRIPAHAQMPGVAGFRLHHPLNRPDVFDEVVAFLGASYFRGLGRGNAYGLSARGLAVNTATARGEEFPRFTRFYVETPEPYSDRIAVHAALDSESVTGAYRFVIRPGAETVMDVTARLFFRRDVEELGVAPLTSMFLFSEKNRAFFDDYRPNVHDSDGLRIERRDGDMIWRPLNNPPRLSGSYFMESAVRRFGLHQRDRAFDSYQDAEAQYERRPSLDVEPLGDWGPGTVRLVEIPTRSEVNDNIVAYWAPQGGARAGETREYAYRLHWGNLPLPENATLAHVHETRSGVGGVSGVENAEGDRKFVVDFRGGILASLPGGAEVRPVVTVSGGEIVTQTLSRIWGTDVWRLVIDVRAAEGTTVELAAHVAGFGRKLSELWLYQWVT